MGLPPRKGDRIKSKAARHAPAQEARIAQSVGGRVVKGSGCGVEKGDARLVGIARIEAKATQRKSFSVTRDMIDKIQDAATGAGEIPALNIEFLDERGKPTHTVYVMPEWAIEELLRHAASK